MLGAFRGMYQQMQRMFKINGCPGAWWRATNGILQACLLSVIVINALTTTWKRVIEDLRTPATIKTKALPPKHKEPQLPTCWWTRQGKGIEQRWVWVCEDPCCCEEMGWLVGGQWRLPPNPPRGGGRARSLYATPPPPRDFERWWCRVGHQQVSLEKTVRRRRRQFFFFILCVYTQNAQNFVENSYLGYRRAAGPNSNPSPNPNPNQD